MNEAQQSIEEILFDLAVQKPTATERAAFLDHACRDNPALRAALDELLESHFGADGFLPKPAPRAALPVGSPTPAPSEAPAPMTGRYMLVEKIGEGGFGEVWMAEQREPVKRRVALKILKLGMDSRQIVARFEAERQALAMMDHPNIAKIFDAGTTEDGGQRAEDGGRRAEERGQSRDIGHPSSALCPPSAGSGHPSSALGPLSSGSGRPYFVMELVRGTKITDYCDQNQLPTKERLNLFIKVCNAIQHAHQKGIIHRDIKPSNILVTVNDGVPVPKVIDFGIAKATQGELTEKTVFTQFQQFIGTPAYISPEQAEMRPAGAGDIDTRADIYSLGVLLYELLVGQTPFDAKEMMKGGIDALRQVIRERDPQRPSTRLNTLRGDARTTAGQRRQTDAGKLVHQLQGDLDWIVMKCLEKDRTRRYDTANGLAADLQRHLANEPVVARPPSTAYRIQKAWQRNKLAFSAAAAIALALLVGTTVSSWQAVRATRAQRNAEQSQAAEREQRRLAQESEARTGELLYAANLNLIQANFEQSNLPMVRNLLEQTRSNADRGFEWYYWQRQLHRETRIFRGHGGAVQRVAFTPDGRNLITSGEDGVILIRDVATGEVQHRLDGVQLQSVSADGERLLCRPFVGYGLEIISAKTGAKLLSWRAGIHPTFSPDGTKFAVRIGERVVVQDSVTGKPSLSFKAFSPFAGFLDQHPSISFSPDGRWILVAEKSLAGGVAAYDALTGDRKQVFASAHRHMKGTFSPDGQRIAIWRIGDGTPYVWEWDRPNQPPVRLLRTDTLAMSFSPDGRRLLGGGSENRVLVWDAETFQLLGQFQGHTKAILDIAFSPDGRSAATASADGTARIWPADAFAGPRMLQDPQQPVPCRNAAFSPDGRYLATADSKSAVIWETATGKALHRLSVYGTALGKGLPEPKSSVESVSFSPDGRRLVAAGHNFVAAVFDVESGQLQLTLHHASTNLNDHRVNSAVFSPDGKKIVTMNNLKVKTWDAESGQLLRTTIYTKTSGLHTMPPVGFTPDGRLYCASIEEVTFWDPTTGEEVFQLPVENAQTINAGHPIIAFSPDGKRFAIACLNWNGAIEIRETASGRLLSKLEGHREHVQSLEFSPDGNRVLSGSRDQMVKLWDSRSGRELLSFKGPNVITCARFAPDGRKIMAGGEFNHGLLWEAATPEQVAAWETEEAAGVQQWNTRTDEFRKRRAAEGEAAYQASRARRAAMEQATAEKLARLGDLSRFAKDPGAIRQWLVLSLPQGSFGGPIQLDEEQLPDEARLRPRAHEPTRLGDHDRVWIPLHLEDYRLDLRKDIEAIYQPMAAYAVSYVLSDRDQSGLVLKFGSDYHAKLYLNQQEIHRSVNPATVEPDRDTVTGIELKAGLNVLVFKVVKADKDDTLPWGGSVRFTNADGSPVTGLTVTLDPDAKQ